jgi:DNA-binding response OmpR family regulator
MPVRPDRWKLLEKHGHLLSVDRLKILVADDNSDCAGALAELLRERGHAVREVYDGRAALAAALDFQPHVMILDIGMPAMNGYQVGRQVRDEPWARDIMMIALSGRGEVTDRIGSQDAGFDYHVIKPMAFEKVVALVERADSGLHEVAKLLRNRPAAAPATS